MKTLPSKHDLRRFLVAGSLPFRHSAFPLAKPAKMHLGDNVVWSDVERGVLPHRPPAFGTSVPSLRDFHVATEVVTIGQNRVTFSNGHAVDANREVLYEKNIPFAALPVSLARLASPTMSRPLVTYLSNTWATNFYHWMCLTLPLLRYYEAAGLPLGEIYVGDRLAAWQERSLELVGISAQSVVTEPCRAEIANVAVSTRYGGATAPGAIEWTRNKLVKTEPATGHRRFFVGRGASSTRRLLDEERIAEALENEFDFEFITTSEMTLDEEIELFAQAEVVVGTHGAALTNLLFAPRGIRVLELRAFDANFSSISTFAEISSVLGNLHGVLRGLPTAPSGREISNDVRVDLDDVISTVHAMLEQSVRNEAEPVPQ